MQTIPTATPLLTSPTEATFKILLIGDSGTGKSSLLLRYTDDAWQPQTPTVGVDFRAKHVLHADSRYRLSIWDTAGQERFRTLTASYYRGAQACLLVYDVGSLASFAHLAVWIDELELYASQHIVRVIVGCKCDCKRAVSRENAQLFATQRNMLFVECSAKSAVGVADVFHQVVAKVMLRLTQIIDTPQLWKIDACSNKINLASGNEPPSAMCSC